MVPDVLRLCWGALSCSCWTIIDWVFLRRFLCLSSMTASWMVDIHSSMSVCVSAAKTWWPAVYIRIVRLSSGCAHAKLSSVDDSYGCRPIDAYQLDGSPMGVVSWNTYGWVLLPPAGLRSLHCRSGMVRFPMAVASKLSLSKYSSRTMPSIVVLCRTNHRRFHFCKQCVFAQEDGSPT